MVRGYVNPDNLIFMSPTAPAIAVLNGAVILLVQMYFTWWVNIREQVVL